MLRTVLRGRLFGDGREDEGRSGQVQGGEEEQKAVDAQQRREPGEGEELDGRRRCARAHRRRPWSGRVKRVERLRRLRHFYLLYKNQGAPITVYE